jgi:hypothetical protein
MKKIIIIVIIVVLGFLAYSFLSKSDTPETGLVSSGGENGIKVGAGLLAALATLDTLKIDTDFFKDQTFKRLVNFSRDIPEQPKGRSNPFAPIGSSNTLINTATTTNAQ